MPKQKDWKRRIRARMQKTGESYTAARARLLEQGPTGDDRPTRRRPAKAPAPDLAALAGMSDEAVAKRTARTWKQWTAVLDRLGAARMRHPEIARHLSEHEGLSSWWAQTVTVGYERIRGLREKGQRRDGGFLVHKSRTYPVPLERLWTGFVRCGDWIGDAKPRMSKATRLKSMRMRDADGTPIEANFFAKGPSKSQVQLQQGALATRADAARLRALWTERLDALGEVLARGR